MRVNQFIIPLAFLFGIIQSVSSNADWGAIYVDEEGYYHMEPVEGGAEAAQQMISGEEFRAILDDYNQGLDEQDIFLGEDQNIILGKIEMLNKMANKIGCYKKDAENVSSKCADLFYDLLEGQYELIDAMDNYNDNLEELIEKTSARLAQFYTSEEGEGGM